MEKYDISSNRNVINNYELIDELNRLKSIYSEFSKYIDQNVRKYLIHKLPCLTINEAKAHKIYQVYTNSQNLNKEVLKSIQNNHKSFHQLLISLQIIKKVEDALIYAREEKIELKSQICFDQFLRKVSLVLEKRAFDHSIREGFVKDIFVLGKNKKWVELLDKQAFIREGHLMKNCLKDNYNEIKIKKNSRIFSLRIGNVPKINIEISNGSIVQVKALANTSHYKYINDVKVFSKLINSPIHIDSNESSQFEMESLETFFNAFFDDKKKN